MILISDVTIKQKNVSCDKLKRKLPDVWNLFVCIYMQAPVN